MALIDDIKETAIGVASAGKKRSYNIHEILNIDETNLTKEFATQASMYGYFAGLLAQAEYELSMAEMHKDEEYALADSSYREQAVNNGLKYTETQIKGMIQTDEDYIAKCHAEIDAKYAVKRLKAVVTGLEQRAQMLISIGSQVRHEADMTGMNIRETKVAATINEAKERLAARKRGNSGI